ncbi:winged helix-turn-helix transcriptional regulator [Streptomyces olivaceus]
MSPGAKTWPRGRRHRYGRVADHQLRWRREPCRHRPDGAGRHGLVRRHAHAEVPPRVEYELTPLGASLTGPIHVLTEWVRENGDAVLDALDAGPGAVAHRG